MDSLIPVLVGILVVAALLFVIHAVVKRRLRESEGMGCDYKPPRR